MKHLISALALGFSLNSHASWDDWDDLDKKLFVAHQITVVADWVTTRYGSKYRSEVYDTYETNIILGNRPSVSKVDAYFIAYLVGNYYFVDWLPSNYRKFYLTFGTVNQLRVVQKNIGIGWKMSF